MTEAPEAGAGGDRMAETGVTTFEFTIDDLAEVRSLAR